MNSTEAIKEYIAWKQSYAPRAGVVYQGLLEEFFKQTPKQIEEVEVGDIVKFQTKINKRFKPASVALHIVALRDFIRYWHRQGVAVIDTYFIRIPRVPYHAPVFVTTEEYLKLCDTVLHDRMKLLIIKFLWQTGVRISELCDIQLSDITPSRECNIQTKKSKRPRWIFWEQDTDALLRQHIKELLETNPRATHVFTNSDGEQITPRSVQRWIKWAAVKAEVRTNITPHSFRHGMAHDLLRNGANPKDVQEMLGHNDPRSSFKYMVLNNTEIRVRARELLDARYNSVDKPS